MLTAVQEDVLVVSTVVRCAKRASLRKFSTGPSAHNIVEYYFKVLLDLQLLLYVPVRGTLVPHRFAYQSGCIYVEHIITHSAFLRWGGLYFIFIFHVLLIELLDCESVKVIIYNFIFLNLWETPGIEPVTSGLTSVYKPAALPPEPLPLICSYKLS